MILKRLEINGFKSFANKTVFEFPAGIAGIVGPNGSGKSNVIDAVRWIVGEREAKNLRGEKIEDLIFAGTEKKQRMSMAQVCLVFDNSSGKLPVDFKEVSVCRRVSRNGNSDYFINDARVRLKDIIDFFSKIRLGSKGLTIVGQGSSDLFVRASLQERMEMVKEILGLREYELKKLEAQRKLANTGINLEKVEAMTKEVAPRLRMLKKQTAKWERRDEVEQELVLIENDYYAFKIKDLFSQKERTKSPLIEIEKELKSLRSLLSEAKEDLGKIEKETGTFAKVDEIRRRRDKIFLEKISSERKVFSIEADLEKLLSGGQTVISSEKMRAALYSVKDALVSARKSEDISEIKNTIKKAIEIIDEVEEEKPENREKKSELESKKKDIREELEKLEKEIKGLEEEEKSVSKNAESFNKRFKDAFEKTENLKEGMKEFEEKKQRISFENEKIEFKLNELKKLIENSGKRFEEFEKLATGNSFEKSFSDDELSEMERKIYKLRGDLASIGEVDQALINEAHEVESYYNFLTKESEDLSDALANLNVLIGELDDKISGEFNISFKKINDEFNKFFRIMFGGGSAKMKIIKKEPKKVEPGEGGEAENGDKEMSNEEEEEKELLYGIDVDVSIPRKKITGLEMLSGGERSLVSLAVLFALISVSPPPFLVLDEVDAALDEKNSKRFSELIKNFSGNSQFIIVTHNRVTMESASILYGVTMDDSGCSKVLSLKLAEAEKIGVQKVESVPPTAGSLPDGRQAAS